MKRQDTIGADGRVYRVCKTCGALKPIGDYYSFRNSRSGTYTSPVCKTCACAREREYRRKRREGGGHSPAYDIIKRGADGRMHHYVSDGHKRWTWRIYWSQSMTEYLERNFARTLNKDLCVRLDISLGVLHRKARELGLRKDPVWLKRVFSKLARQVAAERKIMNWKPRREDDNKQF